MAVVNTQLDAGAVQNELMLAQFAAPKRVRQLVGELDALYASLYAEILGVVMAMEPAETDEFVRVVSSLRRDVKITALLKQIVHNYPDRFVRKVQAMQLRICKETMRWIAGVWNTHTPQGITVTHKLTGKDASELRRLPVEGLMLKEWAALSAKQLESRVLAAITLRRAREKGQYEAGLRFAKKRIRLAVDKQRREMDVIAETAVNMASQWAFDQEAGLFEKV